MTTLRDSDAIPDGTPANKQPQIRGSRILIVELIGLQLPSAPVALALLDAYLQANHWYLSLFHEPSFRSRSILIEALENHIFWILQEATLESVACAVLMSIAYLLERKTQLSFTMSGLGSRAAQAMSIRDETTYIAQAYGKPSILPTVQFNVSEPEYLDDTLATCPGIGSYEVREDGTFKPVTIFSYNRYKAQLYSIADPTAHSIRLPHIKRTYTRLLDWEKTVPRELKLDSFSEYQIMINDDALRVFPCRH
ncbi:transcriptional regulator family: Fungal Specific TF [Penicillium cf. viridicatum]|uniref:Transcriptional regulator family: Fungal Specific TF n=1 Tax=Penicillium cf. viridicatum TaxID=2972119 RepID=A0A9W9JBZ0_9EURO|nr:transcriptional regulator family: Fungal Specific TF [Penicillium cf. viridicatum]